MEYEGIELLNSKLNNDNHIKYFIDIGSNRDKLTCWFAGITNILKSIGIEIVKQRYDDSVNLKNKLTEKYPNITKKIEFICDDVSIINLKQIVNNSSDTLIWISNLCFGQELSDKIFSQILDQMEIGCIIICSKKPFKNNQEIKKNNKIFNYINKFSILMSWTKSSNVLIYQISLEN